MKVGELCAGYGGISMGLALAGEQVDLRWLAEVDRTLDPLHPSGVPNLGDITAIDWTDPAIERVDLLTAGFPCQPFSAAGAQLAEADHRYLWPAVRDAIAILLPPRVLLENVRNLVSIRKGEVWRTILDDLTQLGYDVTWLTLGACRVGAAHHRHRVFALATRVDDPLIPLIVERLDIAECGARRGMAMVPTATVTDARGSRNETAWRHPDRDGHNSGTTLTDFALIVDAFLPTPAARDGASRGVLSQGQRKSPNLGTELALLPSPTARDGSSGPGHTATAEGSPDLRTTVTLLPSPRASVDPVGGPGQRGSAGDLALPSATQPVNFDRFQAAVDRHAAIFGPPPPPTEPNRNGAPRLSAAFAEWLMCIPAGHVTDALPRTQALRAIGNGVCPPQLAAAWRLLTSPSSSVDKPNDTSIGFGAMTTSTGSTSSDVKEIQDRNAAARGRVIAAADEALGDPSILLDRAIEAAMMELAAVWREEAAHVTAAKRKGHIGIAKEYTMAASRLAGFAVGLTTRPVLEPIETPSESLAIVDANVRAMGMTPLKCEACNLDMHRCPGCGEPVNHGVVACAKCSDAALTEAGDSEVAHFLADVSAALPEGDPVAAVFSSPTRLNLPDLVTSAPGPAGPGGGWVAPTEAAVTGDEPIGALYIDPAVLSVSDQSEEQNLRDIIGPLGASSVTATVDHPFTNPGVPWLNQRRAVEVVPYAQLPIIAAALAPRDHVSHSYVESYEGCSLSAMLRDASRAGHIGAARPGWSQIGGKAFHSAVELIERLALSGVSTADDPEGLWVQHFDAAVKEQLDALVGTPYADSATWYISNRGKEGFDWWRVEGAKMLGLYVKHHTSEWRAANPTFLLADTTPVIELPYTMSIRSLDEVRGLTAQGFIDRATLNLTTYSLTVLDYKTGSRDPESTFQLGEYGHALLMAMGIAQEPTDRPILGQYWLARKGIYTDPVPVVTRHPLAELQYRYDAAARGTAAKIFAPHVTNLCKSCSVTDYCPTQAGRT